MTRSIAFDEAATQLRSICQDYDPKRSGRKREGWQCYPHTTSRCAECNRPLSGPRDELCEECGDWSERR